MCQLALALVNYVVIHSISKHGGGSLSSLDEIGLRWSIWMRCYSMPYGLQMITGTHTKIKWTPFLKCEQNMISVAEFPTLTGDTMYLPMQVQQSRGNFNILVDIIQVYDINLDISNIWLFLNGLDIIYSTPTSHLLEQMEKKVDCLCTSYQAVINVWRRVGYWLREQKHLWF